MDVATPQQNSLDGNRTKDLIAQADAAIRGYYTTGNRLRIERLSGETLSLEKCYINLSLTDRTRAKETENISFSMRTRTRLGTSGAGEQITLQEIFMPRELSDGTVIEPRRLFIQGRAGVGKSTLCKKIAHEFLHHKYSNQFDRLLWVSLRRLRGKPERYGWQDFIKDAYSPQVDDWDETVSTISKGLLDRNYLGRTLFLFDGLDEISHGWKRDDPMYEFIADVIFDAPNIIVTSRPQANSFDVGRFDLELETAGFTPDQINMYIDNCIKDKELIPRIKELIKQKPLLQDLLCIPIQLDAFCCTWPDRACSVTDSKSGTRQGQPNTSYGDDLSTMTTLYQSIVNELCIKDTDRLGRAAQPRRLHPTRIRALLKDELDFLEELAFQGLTNGIATFTPDQQDMVESLSCKNESTMHDSFVLERLSFLRTSDIDQNPSKRNYHFLHLTFQEFFAAKHFVRHWKTNTDLICLDLVSKSDAAQVKASPVKFLQTEKYNLRLNIFWRFVTGLMQARTYEQSEPQTPYSPSGNPGNNDVVAFFAHLNEEPLDLLGAIHRRLIMYCLNEVLADHRQEIQALYKSQQDLLRDGLNAEYKTTGLVTLAQEAEFPESILCDLLQNEGSIPYRNVLRAVKNRQFVTTKMMDIVAGLLDGSFPLKTRMPAMELICYGSRAASQNALARTAHLIQVMLKDSDIDSLSELGQCWDMPKQIIDVLLTAVTHKHKEVQEFVVVHIARQLTLSGKITDALVAILRSKDRKVLPEMVKALRCRTDLPEAVIISLFPLLKLEDEAVRQLAACTIGCQPSLSVENMTKLIAMVKGETINELVSAANVFGERPYLSREVITALMVMIKNRVPNVRRSAAAALRKQASLPAEDKASLAAMLKDEDIDTREIVASALRGHSSLPEEIIMTLITTLKHKVNDELGTFPGYIVHLLTEQSSLSAEAIAALITELETGDSCTRKHAAQVLAGRSFLPQEAIAALIMTLDDDCREDIRAVVADVLSHQSLLPEEAVVPLTTSIKNGGLGLRLAAIKALGLISSEQAIAALTTALQHGHDSDTRKSAASALGKYSTLPAKAVAGLIAVVKNEEPLVSDSAIFALGGQSSLSLEAITTMLYSSNGYYYLVHGHNIFSRINDLDDRALRRIWFCWLTQGLNYGISCYERENCLYVWSEGDLHKITSQPAQTQRLLQVLVDVKVQINAPKPWGKRL